jgi:hypothetical protein
MSKPYIALQPSESVLVSSAAEIYSAYVISGHVRKDQVQEWLQRAVQEALLIARTIDETIQADAEMD